MGANASGESTALMLDVVRLLVSQNVEYTIIGAMAVAVHGVVRASVDADALVNVSLERLEQLGEQLTAQGLQMELRRGDPFDPIPAILIVRDQYENRVDLLVGIRGLDPDIHRRAITVDVAEFGTALKFASREDLIAMKLFAGGPIDLRDAERLVAVAGEALDLELLHRLTKRFGRDAEVNLKKLLP